MWNSNNAVATFGLKEIASGSSIGSASQIANLQILVVKWVKEDKNIVLFLINKFGVEMECDGLNLYKTVVSSFMHIILVESTSAEKDKSNFQWSGIFSAYDPIVMAFATAARLKRGEHRFDQRKRLTWSAYLPGPGADLRAREGTDMRTAQHCAMLHVEHTQHNTRAGSAHLEARALHSSREACQSAQESLQHGSAFEEVLAKR
jgi:hypothetical protein